MGSSRLDAGRRSGRRKPVPTIGVQSRAITPPPGDEALLEQLWADLERQLDELEAAPRRFIERDASLLDEFSDRFDGYGLSACGTSRS